MNGITDEQKQELEEKAKQAVDAGKKLREVLRREDADLKVQIIDILKEELPQIFTELIRDGRITLPYFDKGNRRL